MPLPLKYNYRNLLVRKLSTVLTFTVVTVVVFVLAVLLSFAAGIRASLTASGSPCNLVVLKPGATAESTSIILPDETNRLVQAPGIARDDSGRLLISYELCVQTSIARRGPKGVIANVAIRGVGEEALAIRPEIRIIEGRLFNPGTLEAIVGKAASERYANLQVGGQIAIGRLGSVLCPVVGVFEAHGSAFESEIWAPRTVLADTYHRRFNSSAIVRLTDIHAAEAAIAYINGPAVQLEAKRETDYYKDLSSQSREIVVLTTILIGIMAIGAVFAVANTMHAAVDGRRREIATLRAIGFSRRSIMSAFVIESLLICTTACLFGLSLSFFVNGVRQDFLSDATWTVLAYELRITPSTCLAALGVATLVGVGGAIAPAVRAARTPVIEALRKA